MNYKVVCVYDKALGAYGRPIFVPSVGVAIRSFQDEVNSEKSEMHAHPSDYSLHELGEWDDGTAQFSGSAIRRLAEASDFVKE